MNPDPPYPESATPDSVPAVPKQSRPAKVSKSVRVRPWLLDRVNAICAEQELTFNDAVERALEEWAERRQKDEG